MDAELDADHPCLADLNDDLLRNIASRLAESDLASAVALKRCSSRFNDLATLLVANAVSGINTKWRDAADKIGMEGAARIRGGLERNEVLTTLELGSNYPHIRAECAAAIAEALRGNAVLKTLDISDNKIGDEGAAAIAEALRSNEVLTELDLSNNDIRDEGAKAIGEALRGNAVLTSLELWDNDIGDEGAKALASALRVNEVLTTLNLENNGMGSEGAKAIGEALAVNEVLTDLDLCRNNIGDEGAKAIGGALAVNEVLTDLNLSDNNIGGTGWIDASEVEGESKEVGAKVIYQGREMVVSVGVDFEGELQLVDVVQTGVLAIAKALEVNEVLTSINLRRNNLSDKGEKAIEDAVSGREGFKLEL